MLLKRKEKLANTSRGIMSQTEELRRGQDLTLEREGGNG